MNTTANRAALLEVLLDVPGREQVGAVRAAGGGVHCLEGAVGHPTVDGARGHAEEVSDLTRAEENILSHARILAL